MNEKNLKQLPAETPNINSAIEPQVLPPVETLEQSLERSGDARFNIRDAFYDVLKIIPGSEREALNKNLVGMLGFVSKEVKETEREVEDMLARSADGIAISNWQEGLRQKKCALIYYQLALEALREVEITGKGVE